MSTLRTAILLAGLTALFLGVGYALAGAGGMMVALVLACATNAYAYWNADRVVLHAFTRRGRSRRSSFTNPPRTRTCGRWSMRTRRTIQGSGGRGRFSNWCAACCQRLMILSGSTGVEGAERGTTRGGRAAGT